MNSKAMVNEIEVCAHGAVYRKLFPKSTTTNSKAMVNEIEEMGRRLALIHSQRFKKRFKKVLLFDNAAPHREQVTTDKLGQLSYVHMPHPPYSLDISPCNYHYYLSLQDFLVGRDTRIQAVLDNHIEQLINTRLKQFWKDGIRKFAERWQQVHLYVVDLAKQCILPCPLGQKCITKQVQCVRAPCPPIQSCVAVTASDGNNKDTVPSLTCANALCALETPRCVESPNGPKCVAVKKCSETLCPEGELCEQPVPTQDAKCVPDKSACGANEKVRACGALCEGKCENVGKGPIACPTICLPPACSCKDGFYRDGSARCVTAALCQRGCDENEQVDGCGNRCEPTCENAYGKLKVCVLICDPPACTCKLNYFRRDGKCIPQNECR
ncbi:unnamed protein product [Heligmosomoides polygyrus]|uniref:TIL domain-containing protein n=1 Tax=Heligmosomoides polygyrus TaxID=6339 RepID=A0A3P8D4S3_HELPZ|nr:unnamed protein product [Heligmosomoides polygyrus]